LAAPDLSQEMPTSTTYQAEKRVWSTIKYRPEILNNFLREPIFGDIQIDDSKSIHELRLKNSFDQTDRNAKRSAFLSPRGCLRATQVNAG
jgi:hypothetical protein